MLDMGRSRPDSGGVRRLLACLLVAAALPAAASARTDASSVVGRGARRRSPSRASCAAVLVPVARRHGITVRYVSSDGARALTALRAGKAQLALSDSEAAGAAFVAARASLEPTGRLVLYGDDVLVGPASDPAGVGERRAAATSPPRSALIAAAGRAGQADFVAGGIGATTSSRCGATAKVMRGEQSVPVGERWYHYGATDPAAVVRSTAACALASKRCYALVDRAVLRQLQAAQGRARAAHRSSPATPRTPPAAPRRSRTPCAPTRPRRRAPRRARS